MRDVFSFEERDRITRQQQLLDELGADFIAEKRHELCDNCIRQERCRLIPDKEGCCYHDPINPVPVSNIPVSNIPQDDVDPDWEEFIKEE